MPALVLDPHNLPEIVAKVAKVAFPAYTGRKFQVIVSSSVNCRSYWAGGSRDYFVWVRLDTMQVFEMPASHPGYDSVAPSVEKLLTAPGLVCVEHSIFMGRDHGLAFHVHPSSNLLPPPADTSLTDPEKAVLLSFRWKSSYNGMDRPEMVRRETEPRPPHLTYGDFAKLDIPRPFSRYDYEQARDSLRAKGYISPRNALTTAGQNTLATLPR